MRAFTDLTILGKPEAIEKFLPAVEARLPPQAYRDRETERQFKACGLDSRRCFFRWRRFSDDLIFPIDQNPEAICFDEVGIYPGKSVPAPGFPPLLADFFYRFAKPAAEELGLTYYSTAFEDNPREWMKRRHRSEIELTLGWRATRQFLREAYIHPFRARGDAVEEPIEERSIARRLRAIFPSCQN